MQFKNYTMLLRLTVVLSILVSCLFGTAQAQTKKRPVVQPITLRIYTWFNETKTLKEQKQLPELYYQWKGNYIPLTLRNAETTPFFEAARTDGKLHFYKKIISEDDQVTYQSAASAPIDPKIKNAFIYLFNLPNKLHLIPIDLSLKQFPKRSLCFNNLGSQNVILTVNGKKMKALAKKSTVFRYTENEKQTLRIVVQSNEKKPKNLAVMTIGTRPDQRLIGLFYQVKQGGNHRLLIERGADNQAHKFR